MKKKILSLLVFSLVFSSLLIGSSALSAPKKPIPKLNVKKLNMTVGSTFQIRVYNLKKNQKVTYTSSRSDTAAVTTEYTNGKRAHITAFAIGSTTITATVYNGKKKGRSLKCKVKVSPNAVGLKFMKRQTTIQAGQKIRLETIIKPNTSEEKPIFESQDPSIATVNSRGIVTGVSPGTVTITATLLSCDLSTSCTITVLPSGEASVKPKKSMP